MTLTAVVRVFYALCLSVALNAVCLSSCVADMPSFLLNNTAVDGLRIPALGQGTGAYGYVENVGWGGYPECMDESNGCGMYTERTVLTWLKLGGRRLDCANSYGSQKAVGRAMKASGIDRKDIFITQKVGPPPSVPLGYADTMIQMDQMLRDMQTDYVDLLLIHQRVQDIPQAADPYCNKGSPVYSERDCRLSTWRALLDIFKQGKALSVGVSNWNIADLQEIEDAGLPMPAVNQVPFNLYHSSKQQAMREYCASKGILFHGYSALGAPDVFTFPFNNTGMSYIQLVDPSVLQIASTHNKSAAQILIQWQYSEGMPINVRSQNEAHMRENLASYDFTLSGDEVKVLRSGTQAEGPWQVMRPGPRPISTKRHAALE